LICRTSSKFYFTYLHFGENAFECFLNNSNINNLIGSSVMSETAAVIAQLMYLAFDKFKCQVKTADNKFFPLKATFIRGILISRTTFQRVEDEHLTVGRLTPKYSVEHRFLTGGPWTPKGSVERV
jgi:hypothetical protein